MRINFMMEKRSNENESIAKLWRWIFSHVEDFGKTYDVNYNTIRKHILLDVKITTEFCYYMKKRKLLNMEYYTLTAGDGTVLAQGFDIKEDQLLTMRLLETS